jgi:hypothetical protein
MAEGAEAKDTSFNGYPAGCGQTTLIPERALNRTRDSEVMALACKGSRSCRHR